MPTNYEIRQIAAIENWKNREPDAISQLADGLLSPITRI